MVYQKSNLLQRKNRGFCGLDTENVFYMCATSRCCLEPDLGESHTTPNGVLMCCWCIINSQCNE